MTSARPTLVDIARAAGVSTALVSIVMRGAPGASDATRERVKRIADDLGYVPDQRARKLRQTRSRLLGVVFELQQPFHGDLVEHFYTCAAARGYDLVISAVAPSRPETTAVRDLVRERCEAAILLGSGLSDDDLAALTRDVPTLVVARVSGIPGVGSVRGDDVAGISLAVEHLVGLGHRRLAHIDGAGAPGSAERAAGFVAATKRHEIGSGVVTGGLTEADGARGMRELLDRPIPPTAVVAFNDRVATGVLDQLVRLGLDVPGDVSVVGYDDSRLARIPHVAMTTISQDGAAMAEAAVDAALTQVAGEPPVDLVLPPHLVTRATTAGPPES